MPTACAAEAIAPVSLVLPRLGSDNWSDQLAQKGGQFRERPRPAEGGVGLLPKTRKNRPLDADVYPRPSGERLRAWRRPAAWPASITAIASRRQAEPKSEFAAAVSGEEERRLAITWASSVSSVLGTRQRCGPARSNPSSRNGALNGLAPLTGKCRAWGRSRPACSHPSRARSRSIGKNRLPSIQSSGTFRGV